MDNACLGLQADIVCGYGHQAVYLRSKEHTQQRTVSKNETHLEPLNGLVNVVARFEVSHINRGQPAFHRVAMENMDNNAYEFLENPDSDYDM